MGCDTVSKNHKWEKFDKWDFIKNFLYQDINSKIYGQAIDREIFTKQGSTKYNNTKSITLSKTTI